MILPLLLSLVTPVAEPPPAYSGRESQVRVSVPRLEEQVEVDGTLDEAAWERAARLVGFSQYAPVDGRPAENATEVLVWYSPSAIHFGIRAHAASGTVRASLANRDRLDAEDVVEIFLDTFNDGRQATVFAVNPLGVQADGALVEGTRTQGGGFAGLSTGREVAGPQSRLRLRLQGPAHRRGVRGRGPHPFKSLRYQAARQQDWGLNVIRRVQSTRPRGQLGAGAGAPALRSSPRRGRSTGISDLRPGLVLDLNPVVTAKADGAPAAAGWGYDTDRPELGGNVRWGVTSNLTLNGTVNPDFSQVEADASQFTYDPRHALFFPEKRPFFLEGIEQFTTPEQPHLHAAGGGAHRRGQADGQGRGHARRRARWPWTARRPRPPAAITRSSTSCASSATSARIASRPRLHRPMDGRDAATGWRTWTRTSPSARLYALRRCRARSAARAKRDVRTAPLLAGGAGAQRPALRLSPRDHRPPSRLPRGQRVHQPRGHHAREPRPSRDVLRPPERVLGEPVLATSCSTASGATADFAAAPALRDRSCTSTTTSTLRGGWKAGASVLIETLRVTTPSSTTDYALPRHAGRDRDPALRRARPPSTTSTTSSASTRPSTPASRAASTSCGAATRTSSSGRRRTSSTSR